MSGSKASPAGAKKQEASSSSASSSASSGEFPNSGYGIVKSVLSGDQLILMGKSEIGEVVPEQRIILSNISTPRVARSMNQKDEPWAWHAREFLRRKVIGQQVNYIVVQEIEGRRYGIVRLEQEDLAQTMVAAGWAEVRLPPQLQRTIDDQLKENPDAQITIPTNYPASLATLWEYQQRAKATGIGRWTRLPNPENLTPFVRQITFRPDTLELFDRCRNIPLPAQVEKVLDGSTVRCLITTPLPGQAFQSSHPLEIPPQTAIILHLAGVQAPDLPTPAEKNVKSHPLALAAADYVARLLLDRSVHVVLQAVDKRNGLFGTLQFPRGNISLRILERGLGRFVPWSALLTGFENAKAMDLAQQQAILGRTGVWSLPELQKELQSGKRWNGSESVSAANATDPTKWRAFQLTPPAHGEFLVQEVRSGDRLILQDLQGVFVKKPSTSSSSSAAAPENTDSSAAEDGSDNGQPKKNDQGTVEEEAPVVEVSLASIRAPPLGRQGQDLIQELPPFAWQAREYLRRRLIGQKIRAVLEYNSNGRLFVSLYDLSSNYNFGLGLVSEGFATVANHSAYEPRAAQYLNLLQAERVANMEKKGLHGLPGGAEAAWGTGGNTPRSRQQKKGKKPSSEDGKKKSQGTFQITDLTLQPFGARGGRNRRGGKKSSTGVAEEKQQEASAGRAPEAVQHDLRQKTQELYQRIRDKRLTGMVDHVFSATRIKVFLHKHNTFVTVLLAGVRANPVPKSKSAPANPEEAAGQEALRLTRNSLTQRDVKVQIVDLDQYDNFYGILDLENTNWGVKLVREGLASIVPASASRLSCGDELVAGQKRAQKHQRNMWSGYDEAAEKAKREAARNAAAGGSPEDAGLQVVSADGTLKVSSTRIPVTITEIVDPVRFFIRIQDQETKAEQIKQDIDAWLQTPEADPVNFLKTFGSRNGKKASKPAAAENGEAPEAGKEEAQQVWRPERNDVCLGVFSADSQWYRVRVESTVTQDGNRMFQVLFLDYGGYDVLSLEQLKPLDPKLQKLPPTTHLCVLAGVKGPGRMSGLSQEAAEQFDALTLDRVTTAKVEAVGAGARSPTHLTLYVEEEDATAEAADDGDEEEESKDADSSQESSAEQKKQKKQKKQSTKSVQETLLEQGWLRVLSKPDRELRDLTKKLRKIENEAKRRRLAIWAVGDISSSDEEGSMDFLTPPPPAAQ